MPWPLQEQESMACMRLLQVSKQLAKREEGSSIDYRSQRRNGKECHYLHKCIFEIEFIEEDHTLYIRISERNDEEVRNLGVSCAFRGGSPTV